MTVLSVGADIAKKSFDSAVWAGGASRPLGSFVNQRTGFEELAALLEQERVLTGADTIHLVMEPTSGYELALAHFALERGWRVSLPNPKQVRDWAKGVGQRAKTDAQDALLLARFGAERRPPAWAPLPAEVAELDSLLQRQEDLEQMLRQERNRQAALAGRPHVASHVGESLAEVIAALEAALRQVEEQIRAHVKQHASLSEPLRRLRAVPGVGPKSELPLLVLLYRWQALTAGAGDAKGLTAYVGLDPKTHQSGTSVRGRRTISRMGDRRMRGRLYMCALGGVKGQNELRAYYERLVGRGKNKKLALVATGRKVLIWSWAVFRDHAEFTPEKAAPAAA
jgi:transposase